MDAPGAVPRARSTESVEAPEERTVEPDAVPRPPPARPSAASHGRRLGPRAWQPIAGPADRLSFFAEQARHRRATWRLSAVATLAVVLAGLPLSLVVTPLFFLAVILVTRAASLIVPLPLAVPELYRGVARAIAGLMDVVEALDRGPFRPEYLGPTVAGLAALLVPGILVMLALWLLLRRLFSGAGVDGLVIGLGARPPRLDDLEERQLVNVVEEMAIAAGLPAPRVMLLDGEVANAAVVGSGPADAVVVVSRRLLDELDRDETQGILAHLIAAIGNGDLGIALTMVTVFRTFGLVNTLLDAPVSSSARATLRRLVGVLWREADRDAAVRTAAAARLLGSRVTMMELEDVNLVLGSEAQQRQAPAGLTGLLLKVRVFALFPVWAAAGMAKTALMLLSFALLSPLLAWTWRTRRYLADATAVRLTRNPDGIARGLEALIRHGGGIRGGAWAEHLFVVGGRVTDRARRHERYEAELAALRAEIEREAAGQPAPERVVARLRAANRVRQQLAAEAEAAADEPEIGQLGWVAVHPPLASRLKRLQAMGAQIAVGAPRTGLPDTRTLLLALVLVPVFALVGVLITIAVVLSTALVVVFMMIPLGIVYAVFELLF